jgi:hypothetical protein
MVEKLLLQCHKRWKAWTDDKYDKLTENSLTKSLKAITEHVKGENEREM